MEPSVWGRLGKRLGPCRGPPGWFRSLPRRLQGVFFPTPVPEKTKLHTFQEQLREFSVWSGLVWPGLVCYFSMLRCRFGSRMPCGSAGRSDNMARFESSLGCPPDQAPLEASSSQPDQAPASELCFCSNRDRQEPTTGDGRRRGLFFPLPFPRSPSHRHSRNDSGNSRCAACVLLCQRCRLCDDVRSAAPSSAFGL